MKIWIRSKGNLVISKEKTMAEEQKVGHQNNASQLTLDNFDEAEETDEEYGHLTAHLVESETRSSDNNQWTRVFS